MRFKVLSRPRCVSIPVMVNQMNWPGYHCGHTLQADRSYHVLILCVDNNVDTKIDIFLCKVFLFFDF